MTLRNLSLQLNDSQGLAFADLHVCRAKIDIGKLDSALNDCNNALRVFSQARSADEVKETQALLARIDLATGQKPLTIAIIDMDHFKVINDRCGHATGDYVLKKFARVGRECLRESDVLGRWGGEGFLLIMPEATLEFAVASLERLRTRMLGIRLPPTGTGLRVSLSAGLATHAKHGRSLDEMITRADSALYAAKNAGRDLVRIADEGYLATTVIRRAIRQ